MRLFLTGSNGQLGRALHHQLSHSEHQVYAPQRAECDLTNTQQMQAQIEAFRPDIIINPAAYTAVDQAQSEPELAYAINTRAVEVMASYAKKTGAIMLHYSTDYVFNGSKSDAAGNYLAYQETDHCAPLNCYGETKRAGELILRESGAAHICLRTSWVYTWYGKNFLLTMLKLAQQRPELSIVADQFGAPTSADFLARTSLSLLANLQPASHHDWWQEFAGIYHLTCSGQTSWHGFATEIFSQAQQLGVLNTAPLLHAIPAANYPTPAQRPHNSQLNCEKIQQKFGLQCTPWQQALTEVLQNYRLNLGNE